MLRVARLLWAGPWSLLGLLLGATFRSRRVERGVLVCEGASWPRKIGWRYRAIALGHVVLVVDRVDEELMAHERVHVAQYERWGPLFIPVYLLAGLLTKLRGGRAYADNPFELAARSAAHRN